jgi:hypothetical protein
MLAADATLTVGDNEPYDGALRGDTMFKHAIVNGFAVSVPYSRLPELLSSGIAKRVFPSLSYNLDLNRGPSVVGAPQFSDWLERGAGREGGRRRRWGRSRASVPRSDWVLVPAGLPEGIVRCNDAEGDRRARLRGAGCEQLSARP